MPDHGRAVLAEPTAVHSWTFSGRSEQVRVARRALADTLGGCPAADEIILCLSELTTNAVRHSASGCPSGTFTVRAEITASAGVYLEVTDNGGPWQPGSANDGRLHGLGIVQSLAASLSISGSENSGWVIAAWFAWTNSSAP